MPQLRCCYKLFTMHKIIEVTHENLHHVFNIDSGHNLLAA